MQAKMLLDALVEPPCMEVWILTLTLFIIYPL